MSALTQKQMHAVLHQLLLALVGGLSPQWIHSSRCRALGGGRGVLLSALCRSESGAVEPEGHGVQDGSPGVAVVQPGRVDGLRSVEGPTLTPGRQRAE